MKSSAHTKLVPYTLAILLLLALAILLFSPGVLATRPAAGTSSAPLGSLTPRAYLPAVLRQPPLTPSPTSTPTPTPTPTPTVEPGWSGYLNRFRAQASLNPLVENGDWSYGGVLHGRYMVKNDVITHYEDSDNPWYTLEGDAAGQNGDIMVSSWVNAPDESAIDLWMTGPFHAISILDPQLHTTGFGSYREDVGTWKMGATLDVLRGLGSLPPGTVYPLPFPKNGGETWLFSYGGNEWPDPLTSCPGYSVPSGPPIMLQIGSGELTPNVTAHSFSQGGAPLEHCIFDETNYANPDSYSQDIGRIVLNNRDAVVIMPRASLIAGQTYQVSIAANGETHSWSFTAVSEPLGRQLPAGEMFRFH